jgi:ATP-dependent DNA helicase RecG
LIIKEQNLLPLSRALWQIHFPDSLRLAQKARQRFSFEELFFLQLSLLQRKIKLSREKAFLVVPNLPLIKEFIGSLPFKLTDAQRKAAWQILKDMEKPKPMARLLEGDVGSGKTIVAAIAALSVLRAGYQAVLMAPTEILAEQHFLNIGELFKKFKLQVGLLTSERALIQKENKPPEKILKKELLQKIQGEQALMLIGTHSLIQRPVKFKKLALVIMDEQHRFGVEQRAKLARPAGKSKQTVFPHLLSMSATPIPRSLNLTLYGDLDLSLIDELPKQRRKIITKIIPPKKRGEVYQFIREQVGQGRQAFIVCPRIENQPAGKEKPLLSQTELKAVKEEYEKLSKEVFPDLKIAMLHGKMKAEEKEKAMNDFKNKKSDILVSTSVIEVGLDIANASVIAIEGVERFGLAQLHQFRGRVGRSSHQSFCFLFTNSTAGKSRQRLSALVKSENGFELAEKDLKIRGPGDFLGQRQSGLPDLAMESLANLELVKQARAAARAILLQSPRLEKYPAVKLKLKKFKKKLRSG